MQNKILLSWVVQHLSKTAADANSRLCNDYISAAKKLSEADEVIADFTPLPPPLVITGMKMKFSANVSRGDKALGGDLMLEFGKPANFHGEIELKPYSSHSFDMQYQENEPSISSAYENEPYGDIDNLSSINDDAI